MYVKSIDPFDTNFSSREGYETLDQDEGKSILTRPKAVVLIHKGENLIKLEVRQNEKKNKLRNLQFPNFR